MIGNDIIDLGRADLRNRQRKQRYLSKIATAKEQLLVQNLGIEDQWVWLLWSIKESVYKIIARKEQKVRFAPKSIECLDITSQGVHHQSIVRYEDVVYTTYSVITKDYIHTTGSDSSVPKEDIYSKIIGSNGSTHQSADINHAIRSYCQSHLSHEGTDIKIMKDGFRIPRLYINGEEKGYVSISHDERFGAFVYFSCDGRLCT